MEINRRLAVLLGLSIAIRSDNARAQSAESSDQQDGALVRSFLSRLLREQNPARRLNLARSSLAEAEVEFAANRRDIQALLLMIATRGVIFRSAENNEAVGSLAAVEMRRNISRAQDMAPRSGWAHGSEALWHFGLLVRAGNTAALALGSSVNAALRSSELAMRLSPSDDYLRLALIASMASHDPTSHAQRINSGLHRLTALPADHQLFSIGRRFEAAVRSGPAAARAYARALL